MLLGFLGWQGFSKQKMGGSYPESIKGLGGRIKAVLPLRLWGPLPEEMKMETYLQHKETCIVWGGGEQRWLVLSQHSSLKCTFSVESTVYKFQLPAQ